MGRKKTTSAAAEEVEGDPAVAVSKKNKKKGQLLVDDDEYMVVDQLDDDDSVISGQQRSASNGKQDLPPETETDLTASFEQMGLSQKKKTKGKKSEPDPDDAGSELSAADEGAGKKKGKKGKKGLQVEDDEYDVSAIDDVKSVQSTDSSQSHDMPKKGKKGAKIVDVEDDASERLSSQDIAPGKKKNRKGKSARKEHEDEDYMLSLDDVDRNGSDVLNEDLNFSSSKNLKKSTAASKPKMDDMYALLAELDGSADAPERGSDSDNDDPGSIESGDLGKVADLSEEVVFTGKKKSKKGGKHVKAVAEDIEIASLDSTITTESTDAMSTDALEFTGKKKAKGKKGSGQSHEDDFKSGDSGSGFLDDHVDLVRAASPQDEDVEFEESLVFSGKKKSKKGKDSKRAESEAMGGAAVVESSGLLADESVLIEADDTNVFSGKKKGKNKKGGRVYLDEDMDAISTETVSSDVGATMETVLSAQVEDETKSSAMVDEETIQFSGKKKGKKGKKSEKPSDDPDIEAILAELEGPKTVKEFKTGQSSQTESPVLEVTPVTLPEDSLAASKKKPKKGKKSGRTAQEEEDLDAILAELDGPKVVKQPEATSSESLQAPIQPADATESAAPAETGLNEAEAEDVVESAASKKKKKKKEKEKEKAKTAAAGKQVELAVTEPLEEKQGALKGKVPDKKVPKHIREMQEALAKQREAEERRKREEEERQRKEEEEQRRLEELERQKEEAKRRRKEREKEKLMKKKQEGKLLTGKQKEEARRLALMREQMLAQKGHGDADAVPKEEAAPKKPKYESKKKRRPHGVDTAPSTEHPIEEQEVHTVLGYEESPMEIEPAVEKEPEVEVPEEEVEVEEEIDEDWDAKSWEAEVELPAIKSAFAEEEDGPVVSKKATKRVVAQPPLDLPPAKRPTSPQKPALRRSVAAIAQAQTNVQESEDDTESEDETESEEEDNETRRRREAVLKREARKAEAFSKRSADDLRSPICCILGHVDTGKTKLLDCIRRTNVQEGEAGGITQQIGATYFPMENIRERTKELKADAALRVPGLLVIDTPGHESFTNLRARGSGLCDIAILVIDIMHGLEPQTIESLNLLKMRHTPFVVALNKVDRLYNWKTSPNAPIRVALKQQSTDVLSEFDMRLNQIMTQLKEQGMNSELYFKNKEIKKFVSIVPTSAISGEGIPDLLMLLVQITQKRMEDKLMYISEVQCTVLEVKVIEGLGTTIDVILVNGVLHEGDQIVVCGMQGPIVTNIRALLTPHPMKELRVKGSYQHHKELKAAQGIKLTAQGLEHAIAGTQLHVVGPEDELEDVKVEAMQDMKNVMSRVDKSGEGVCVQASTLGSLEALLEFLKSPAVKIPVSGINIGPVHKRDVMRASVMLERRKKEYATILAFDVKVTPEAKELAEELGVRIFMADIIYHLFDQFTAYMNNIKEEKRKEVAEEAVFPCVLGIKPQFIFNKKDPIILGVDVLDGVAKVGTPLCVPSKDGIDIGRIASMEVNHKVVDTAKKGQAVAMKIVGSNPEETQKMFGRHFDHEDELVSHITRRSIDVLKENFRDALSVDEWKLVVKLKKLFNIP